MTQCHYCGVMATYKLDEEDVCYDCLERLRHARPEQRVQTLIDSLQVVHATVLRLPASSAYKHPWLASLAERIAYAQGRKPPVPVKAKGAIKMAKFK